MTNDKAIEPVSRSGTYGTLRRSIDAVDAVLVTVGAMMLFGLMCVVVSDVSMRYVFNQPLQWSYEVINNYLMPGLFFFAVSHTLKAHSHVAVDILHNYVARRTRYIFESIATLAAIPVFAISTWVATQKTVVDFRTSATASGGLELPSWTVSIMFPIGFGLLTLRLVLNAIGFVGSLLGPRTLLALPPISGTEEGAE